MKLFAGTEELNIPELFSAASRRIILNGAVYGPFAKSARHMAGLETALTKKEFRQLDIIAINPALDLNWKKYFLEILRFGISRQSIEDEVEISYSFIAGIAEKYPAKVKLHPVRKWPNLPLVIVDDTLCFGQYAYAAQHAPQGFWGMVEADVEKMFEWTKSGRPPANSTKEEIAAFRLINECAKLMNISKL
ncbi:hypothetical protein [Desulfovibrio gilichinskyi]|uniref:Uncharacterized protein n=1 Tax=Desulfovibrio gilichinskyi TaxID=1519643 RepID=A0A1X7C1C1_9BACT|nr:hypothetical protein [Desulfovibrio gilichinskyi]SME88159.1 hypothetical protein SAMN06295933_0120 [Desulfovibrio gilichinskyi]